jgi:hypothetical protein
MKSWILATTTLALAAGTPLLAQEPHFGLGVIVGIPTGGLSSTSYGPNASFGYPSQEKYDTGLGVQFTVSWPVDRSLAMRLNVSAIGYSGTGSSPVTSNWNLQDDVFSLGGEAEVFLPDGNAMRHVGTYLIGGLHMDFERFSASDYDPSYFPATSVNKNRLALTAGIGHAFRSYGRYRWTLEAVYHKTLTETDSDNSAGVGFPASDNVKLYFGFGF